MPSGLASTGFAALGLLLLAALALGVGVMAKASSARGDARATPSHALRTAPVTHSC